MADILNLIDVNNLGYQATAYERNGIIDFENFKVDMLSEVIHRVSDSDLIRLYNDFLEENERYEDRWYDNDDDFYNIFFENNPMEAIRSAVYACNYDYTDAYVRINDYGNLETCTDYELIEEITDDKEFKAWLFDNYNDTDLVGDLIEFINDKEDEIIEYALDLVKKGY